MLQRSYTKWKSFIERRMGQESHLAKEKKGLLGAMTSFWREGEWYGFVTEVTSSSGEWGSEWRGPLLQMTSLGLTRKFQTVWLRLHFWWGLRLQLGYVSSWGIMASSISYAFWSLWFFSLTGERNRSLNMCVLYWFGIFPEVLRTLVSGLPFWPPSLHFLFLSLAEGY